MAEQLMNLLIHTHRCQKLFADVKEDITIPDLKARVEGIAGEGKLFRITGRSENPGLDEEYKLIFHGQVLEDYDGIASANLPRLESLKKKLAEKQKQVKELEPERKELQKELQESGQQQGQLTSAGSVVSDHLKKALDDLRKQESEVKKEEKALGDLVNNLQKKCGAQKLSAYYTGGPGCMLHIVSAKTKPGLYKIRINYLGRTVESSHCRCERVSSVLENIRAQHDQQLPHSSNDFKISDALFWRCAATRMVRLSSDKCLCEYGIADGSTFEHEIEKVPVSKQAQCNFANLKRKTSRIKNGTPTPAPGTRRSRSSVGILRSSGDAEASTGAAQRSHSSTSAASSRGSACSSSLDDIPLRSPPNMSSANSAVSTSASTGALPPLRPHSSASASDSGSDIVVTAANLPSVADASCLSDLQGSALYGPSRNLVCSPPDEVCSLKERALLAQKELRRAQRHAAKAEKALKQSELKRQLAEAEAARARSESRVSPYENHDAEIETARQAQRAAETALRRNTRATFTALEANRSHNATSLPQIGNQTPSGPTCVVCFDAPAEVMAYPCGHRCYCETCASAAQKEFADGSDRLRRCAVCREPLVNLVRVF